MAITWLNDDSLNQEWGNALSLCRAQFSVLGLRKVVLQSSIRWAQSIALDDPNSSHPLTFQYGGGADPSITIVVSSFVRGWRRGEVRELLCLAAICAHAWLIEGVQTDRCAPSETHKLLAKHLGCDWTFNASPATRHLHIGTRGGYGDYRKLFVEEDWPICSVCDRPLNSDDPELIHRGCEYYVRTVVMPAYKRHIQQSNSEN